MSASPQDLVRPDVMALSAYHVPPATGMIKLDAMENPYRLPEALRDVVSDVAHGVSLNRYPDASCTKLKSVLRESMQIPESAGIVVGNGSDELIQIIAMALAKPGATILSIEPSFVMYRMIATFCGMRYVGVPLREDFSLDVPAVLAAIEQEKPAVLFIAYPNNPTGNLFASEDIVAILQAAPGIVVIDEAYTPFAGKSFMSRLAEFPNLVVMRTLSKLGLAALRLGYMAGAKAWMDEFEKLRLPYNINTMTQAIATRVLEAGDALQEQAEIIVAERARVYHELAGLKGVKAFRSQANFVLLRVPDAVQVFNGLKARQILVKNLHAAHPMLENCIRVTIGTPAENDAFLNVLSELL
ncbi:histidinol-phosphate transaminase [Uliginosibacterium sp. H3]|uniref:Histidinol-phosphate aminotransferase n=1 Tax=Uliginosibacterium silvisoli TaxID=3114758 RepID=A0ABU6K462_9RHOO|nr:histidinol-phosphate transaminase [Uliginosibacterium sp. H3]